MLENRPIVVITIGYIIGILMGLYCKISIVFLYLIIFIIYLIFKKPPIKRFKLISFRRYFRYLKIIFTKRVFLIIIITSIISNSITLYQNYRYQNLYSKFQDQEISVVATVVSNAKQKDYTNVYKIKVKNTYLYLNTKEDLEYGEKIKVTGEFQEPSTRTNYRGFDYKEYLKTLKIYGTIKAKKIEEQSQPGNLSFLNYSNSIFLKIKDLIQNNFDEKTASILLGILLGYTDEIDEDVKSSFQESNISHVLAVSGMHIGYLVLFLKVFLEKLIGNRKQKIATVFVLIIYMFITGFSPSVVRAGIMGILSVLAGIFYRKSDKWQNISLALLILLIYNPFLIESTSVWLTFFGTIGILTISVWVFITPIMAVCYNKIAVTSVIIGAIIGVFIGPIFVCGFMFIIFYNIFDFLKIKVILINLITFLIKAVTDLSDLGSNLPFNKIYVTTPGIFRIILFFGIVFICWFLYSVYKSKNPTIFQKRVKNLISLLRYRFNQNKKKVISIVLIFTIICCVIKVIPGNLKIYFIDVGQGDASLIVTPKKQTILIDGGGSETYDVGKNILLPYLLDRGIKSLDYAIISHFDTDHIGRSALCYARNQSGECNYL